MLEYPVRLTRDDNGTILVKFPDIPEAVTFGTTEEDALTRAQAALDAALDAYLDARRDIPTPSRTTGPTVSPSADTVVRARARAVLAKRRR